MPQTTARLLDSFAVDPGRPRLTWYGPDAERIELSGAVLVNWVSKTTNLLVEELEVEPDVVVDLDLPPHWRTLVWALATWRAGGHLRVVDTRAGSGEALEPARVVVTTSPAGWLREDGTLPPRLDLVAVSLPALARRFDGDLPARAIDAASAVMTYGDRLGYVPATDPRAVALSGEGQTVVHGDLLAWAGTTARETPLPGPGGSGTGGVRASDTPPARALIRSGPARLDVLALLAHVLQVWSDGGSVVVLAHSVAEELDADGKRLDRLVSTERITHGA